MDIPEHIQAGLLCRGTPSNHTSWRLYPRYSDRDPAITLAACNSTMCEVAAGNEEFLVARPNVSSSVLYMDLVTKRQYHKRVECHTEGELQRSYCLLRVVCE